MFGRKCKFFSKFRLGLGLISGALLGMLTTPKKGKDVREYLGSDEFKEKMSNAEDRVGNLRTNLQDKAKRFVDYLKKRFSK